MRLLSLFAVAVAGLIGEARAFLGQYETENRLVDLAAFAT